MNSVSTPQRRTIITFGRLAMREQRLQAARERIHGLQILTIEQFAARLAGGFLRAVNPDQLRAAIQTALPKTNLGELDGIKCLPGFVRAVLDTLSKVWHSGINLESKSRRHPRIAAIASLERAVLAELPTNQLRPGDLAARARKRIQHARAIFGDIQVHGLSELAPCWRELLQALPSHTDVEWVAEARGVPAWLDGAHIRIRSCPPQQPRVRCVSAATAYHEAVEAVRWARQLVASGQARPQEIAIAAATTADYDDHFLALSAEASLDIHFVHGAKVAASAQGQAAAALADLLLRGLSQSRVRRLARFLASDQGPFPSLPKLPPEAPLTTPESWQSLIQSLAPDAWQAQNDQSQRLQEVIRLLAKGVQYADEIGAALLTGATLALWRKALLLGPPAALELSLEALRKEDALEPCSTIIWAPASALVAAPRPHVYLLGLNSQRWPRLAFEDRLLSDHIIATSELDPLPVNLADTKDFATLLATTTTEVVLSRARRDSESRLLGRSVLLQPYPEENYLRRNRIPQHALSETDRLTARQDEFREFAQAKTAYGCWRNWNTYQKITAHDGLVRQDHPVIRRILKQLQSASSLRRLLRNPLGYIWRYGLGLRFPQTGEEPLTLDAATSGQLVHEILEQALRILEVEGGIAKSTAAARSDAITQATERIAQTWALERPVPPRSVWQQTLADAQFLCANALRVRDEQGDWADAFAEVPFGGAKPNSAAPMPWNPEAPVVIPGTDIHISGYIDRIDLSANRHRAWVRDYKTGKMPQVTAQRPFTLDQGKELQRCLYAYAVQAMLGETTEIRASLHFLREDIDLPLDAPEDALSDLAHYLGAAQENLVKGSCVIGESAAEKYDDLAFALPANAANVYCKRKMDAAKEAIGRAADIWEVG